MTLLKRKGLSPDKKMEEGKTVIKWHYLGVKVHPSPPPDLVDHMHSTILGTPGGFRYRHTDLVDRLSAPGENYFILLRKSGRMLGSVGFVGRHTRSAGVSHDSWMIRYFSIKAPMRSVPKQRKEKEDLRDTDKRGSVLARFIGPVFANPSVIRGEEDRDRSAIIYALIEQKNLRSMNFSSQMGMETIGEVANFSFSRLRPGIPPGMDQLSGKDIPGMKSLLAGFYRDYMLFFPEQLFGEQPYHVIRREGRVVAGLQAYPVTWQVVDFGSPLANRLVRWGRRIPWIRKRVDPEGIRIQAFDGIYCEEGQEDALYSLMEGVLARSGSYVGMIMADKSSSLYGLFRDESRLGPLHRVLGTFMADVRARFINIPEHVIRQFREYPTYIPTYDNS